MTAVLTDVISNVTGLSDSAFGAFCEDIADMFDVDMRCERRQAVVRPVVSLREQFKKLTAVHFIQAEGTVQGPLYLVFDQGGLFILGGVIVMLPEPRILEGVKKGSLRDAESLQDASREAGNLLVGSWDRVFRRDCEGHKHFLKTSTFIGKPWDAPGQPELQVTSEALIVQYEITIEPYPSFTCVAVLPTTALEGRQNAAGAEPAPPAVAPEVAPPQAQEAPAQKEGDRAPSADRAVPAPEPKREPAAAAADGGTTTGDKGRPMRAETPQAAVAVPKVQESQPQVAQSGPPKTEDRGQRTEDRGQKTEDRGQKAAPSSDLRPPTSESRPSSSDLVALLRLPAAEIMDRNVVWADPEDTVQDVLAQMQQHNVGYVLVGRNGVLEGLISSSNILGAVSLYLRPLFAKWRRPEDDATLGVKVKWIMSRPVRTVRTDASVALLIESLRRCGGRCLPVVDAHGAVQGLVTVFDILLRILAADQSFSWQGQPPQAPALLL